MTARFVENGSLLLGDNDTKAIRIQADTVDGVDDYRLLISSGGAAGPNRGAYFEMHANEFSSQPGRILWESGTAASGTNNAWTVNVGASTITGHSIDGNGKNVFSNTGSTQTHLFNGTGVDFTASAGTVTFTHNYSNGSLRAQVGVNGSAGKIISVGTTNAYTIACAAGVEFGDLANNLFASMSNQGIWTFGDGNLPATTSCLKIRKTNAINNRLIEGIDAATRGYVRINAAQTNLEFEGASDRRIKTEISTIENAINKVMDLNPVTFRLKTGVVSTQGFIAQEFAEVFPQAVTATDEGLGDDLPEGVAPWSMSDSCLIPYLVKAIQELKAEIEVLKGN